MISWQGKLSIKAYLLIEVLINLAPFGHHVDIIFFSYIIYSGLAFMAVQV